MGDRCYVSILVHPEDEERLIQALGEPDEREEAQEGAGRGFVHIHYEANYGYSIDLEELAAEGVRFDASAGQGGSYPGCLTAAFGGESASLVSDGEQPVVRVRESKHGGAEANPDDLELAARYFTVRKRFLRSLPDALPRAKRRRRVRRKAKRVV